MSKWILSRPDGPWEYPSLGFTASTGDILDATSAPDAYWTLNGNQSAAETVHRYGAGGSADSGYTEPPNGAVLRWNATTNQYEPGASVADSLLVRSPDLLITGTITRDANGAATSAPVTWPDGTPGTYTATTVSTAFPGAVDAYTITYGSPVTKTYTQPTITRDATGAATNVPAIVVS